MSGYSQGGQIVHAAADLLKGTAALKQVAAGEFSLYSPPPRLATEVFPSKLAAAYKLKAVIFGDPDNGDPVGTLAADKVKVICHKGDNICDGGIIVLPPHLNYQIDAQAAAQFVASKVV